MPIISPIGRRSPGIRALFVLIYLLLGLGAVTMIYPFLIMLTGSTQSAVDLREQRILPAFLFDDDALYRKHIEALFNESTDLMNATYDLDVPSFDRLTPPDIRSTRLVEEWRAFLKTDPLPEYAFGCGYLYAPISRTTPLALREFRTALSDRFGPDIENLNRALDTEFTDWNSFFVLPANYLFRQTRSTDSAFERQFAAFKQSRPVWMRYGFSAEGFYKKLFLKTQYTREIAEYNRLHQTDYASYDDIHLAETLPSGTEWERKDWEQFVRHTLNLLWIRVSSEAVTDYRAYLSARYTAIDSLNAKYGTVYPDFDDIPLPDAPPAEGLALSDWESFIAGWRDPDTGKLHLAPAESLRIKSLDILFRKYVQARYSNGFSARSYADTWDSAGGLENSSTEGGHSCPPDWQAKSAPDIETLNNEWGTDYTRFEDIFPPQREEHYLGFLEQRGLIKRHFLARNYQTVLDYLLFHGRGILNTVIYCLLAVLFGLLVNPLAAYALSRYRPPGTYRILLFLMLTMAFPPMVTQIPVFLMLRDLRLLNTFAALILPGLANGYSIFLLKGFFDSLPRELYENAQLDGAGEWTMFWNITMRLSMPILAVLALASFTAAYTNFMFALLICQDERMWTMMVWLYELQQRSGPAVLYASLIVAALPTFLIFFLCQKIIIRGIVVPMEK